MSESEPGDPAPSRVRRVAVTTLADFACRSGDLDPAGVVGPSAREGMLAHQRVQATFEGECEVRLTRRLQLDGETIELGGRVDLLDRRRCLLGEIKSTMVPAERVPPSHRALHRGQLMLYGWLWLASSEQTEQRATDAFPGDTAPLLELIYVNLRGGPTATERVEADVATLERHAKTAIERWLHWQRGVERRRRALATSAGTLDFPHARFRDGQRTLSVAIYRCLRDGGSLLCEAPTGSGKTISTLYPALKALGEGRRRQVLYLTAKVSGRHSAGQALAQLAKAGLAATSLTLRSRAAACFCERGRCARDAEGRCPMTSGFFDRLPAARDELMARGVVDAATLDDAAWRHALCPHALAAELRPWVDVVVADFNHVFDPIARLAGLDESRPGVALLVDEAHNLLERSRAMYSADLSREACDVAARALQGSHPLLGRQATRLGSLLSGLVRGQAEGTVVTEAVPRTLVRGIADALERFAEASVSSPPLPEEGIAFLRVLTRVGVIAELHGDDHRTLLTARSVGRRREVAVRLACLDAAPLLSRQCALFGACAMFSATLAPFAFYRDALGLPPSTPTLSLPSPFDPGRALHCVVPWIDTRWRARESSLAALVALIARVSDRRAGNYLVFLPSYAYLERVHTAFAARFPTREIWRQEPGQDADGRAVSLARLATPGHRIGFAILGGVFGEGVDYVGDRLIGVIVVGTGLGGPGVERELIVGRYREKGLDGFDLAARFPGFTRVQQTVGRVIRGERDRGVVVLVDDRFWDPFYRALFPAHWNAVRAADGDALQQALDDFWALDDTDDSSA